MFKNTKKSAEIACISADFMIFNRLFVVPPGIEPGTQGFSVINRYAFILLHISNIL